MLRRQKSVAPQTSVKGLTITFLGDQDDEGREIFVVAPKAVINPGTDGWTPRKLLSGLDQGCGRIVVDRFGVHRVNDAEIVRYLGRMWQQTAEPGSGLAVP